MENKTFTRKVEERKQKETCVQAPTSVRSPVIGDIMNSASLSGDTFERWGLNPASAIFQLNHDALAVVSIVTETIAVKMKVAREGICPKGIQ